MDVSKLCINNEDVVRSTKEIPLFSRERPATLPSMTELLPPHPLPTTTNNSETVNTLINQNNSLQFKYQQRYLQQHKNLKSYIVHHHQQQNESSSYYYLQQQSQPQQQPKQQQHGQPPTPHLQRPNIQPQRNSSKPNNNKEQEESSAILSQLLEQCSMIYSRIGKYRVDPLTETERSHIIDQVYFTTEIMLRSLRQLHASSQKQQPEQQDDLVDEITTSSTTMQLDDDMEENEQDTDDYKVIRQARNLQENNSKPKYRRRSKRSMVGQTCHSCNTSSTPEWRRGPDGARTLCNACGLHYSKLLRKGSMTVQTHNYMLESPPEFKRAQRIIQFPIYQESSSSSTSPTLQHVSPHLLQQQLNYRMNNTRTTESYSDDDSFNDKDIN